MGIIKRFNEDVESDQVDQNVIVKDLIQYLSELDPEAIVLLDKEGWEFQTDGVTTVRQDYLFQYSKGFGDDDEHTLFINN